MIPFDELLGLRSGQSRPEDFSRKGLLTRLLEICEEHRRTGRALVFAFILYDPYNANINKILYDRDYWDELDHLSGSSISVFSLHSPALRADRGRWRRFWSRNANPLEGFLEELMGTKPKSKSGVVFFQVERGAVVDPLFVRLKEEKLEEGFVEIKQALKTAVNSLSRVEPQYRGNSRELLYLVTDALRQNLMIECSIRNIKVANSFYSVAKSISGVIPRT